MSLAEGSHLRWCPRQRPIDQPTTGLLGAASLTRQGLQPGGPSGPDTTPWLSGPPSHLPAEMAPVQGVLATWGHAQGGQEEQKLPCGLTPAAPPFPAQTGSQRGTTSSGDWAQVYRKSNSAIHSHRGHGRRG